MSKPLTDLNPNIWKYSCYGVEYQIEFVGPYFELKVSHYPYRFVMCIILGSDTKRDIMGNLRRLDLPHSILATISDDMVDKLINAKYECQAKGYFVPHTHFSPTTGIPVGVTSNTTVETKSKNKLNKKLLLL